VVLLVHFFLVPLVFAMPDWIVGKKYAVLSGSLHPLQTYVRMLIPRALDSGAFGEPCFDTIARCTKPFNVGIALRTIWALYILTSLLLILPGVLYLARRTPAFLWCAYGVDVVFLGFWAYFGTSVYKCAWGL
jgi:hypothetical protein